MIRGLGFGFLVSVFLGPALHSAAWASHAQQAEALYRGALVEVKRGTFESRREAMQALERATLLAPDSAAYHMELAQLYYQMGFLGQARKRYERVGRLAPNLIDGHVGQGKVWRRDYLKYLEPLSLERSLAEFRLATRLAPGNAEAWLQQVPLLVERSRFAEALKAAEAARAADPSRVDALLALGQTAYRMGQVERADSAFRSAIPRLPRVARERFADIAPVATERDTSRLRRLSLADRERFLARFWKDSDPDWVTPVNEAQLEYWSRVAQAYALYFSVQRQAWDQRGEVYVRYGPPKVATYNPVGAGLYFRKGIYGSFPMNVMVWHYPDLGMEVPMYDRLLSENYMPAFSKYESTDPYPHPDSVGRANTLAIGEGRGVFPMLPPGSRPIPVTSALGRFSGDDGPRILAWLETPGTPSDSLWAEWVVLDSTRAEVTRVRRPLSASACDVGQMRAAEFAATLPPGDYVAGLSVRGTNGRRGVERWEIRLEPTSSGIGLSDLVVSCGTPVTETGPSGEPQLRFAANVGARVFGNDPLTAYFEAYRLAPGSDGRSRLEFEYVVRSAERDPRIWIQRMIAPRPQLPDISATRQEDQLGDVRRQAVSVPVQSLPPGRYLLEIRVRDLVSGTEARRSAEFVKVGRGS